jgi:hypothetical protein
MVADAGHFLGAKVETSAGRVSGNSVHARHLRERMFKSFSFAITAREFGVPRADRTCDAG